MSFAKRKIDVIFELGSGSFGAGVSGPLDQVSVSGLRVIAAVTKAGDASMGGADLYIYGLAPKIMQKISTFGKLPMALRNNRATVLAGSDDSPMAVVCKGTIADAYIDFRGAPEVAFSVEIKTGLFEAVKPIAPTSYKGSADVATMLAGLANSMNLAFEDAGVQVKLWNPYYPGTARQQVESIARAADINWVLDNGRLAIWPKTGERGGQIPLISPTTGMIGYPSFNPTGIIVETEYNPTISFGAPVIVDSGDLPKGASGKWVVYSLWHDLESELQNGQWRTRFLGAPPGYVPITSR